MIDPTPLSPRLSPRAARTRSALIAAGLDLMAERPVDAIPIDDLVAAAGVAKGSFFNHFADKRAFAQSVAEDIRGDIEACVTRFNAETADPLDRLARGMIAAAMFAIRDPRRTAVLAGLHHGMDRAEHPLNRGVLGDMRGCIAAGSLRPDVERTGVLFWLGCCQTTMAALAERRAGTRDAADLIADMLAFGLSGLGADGGRIGYWIQGARLRAFVEAATRSTTEAE